MEYEKKYRLLSAYFHKLYKAGKLEEKWDFQNWAGLYEIKLDHKHIHPDIKHNRIPTPQIQFDKDNLALLIREIIDSFFQKWSYRSEGQRPGNCGILKIPSPEGASGIWRIWRCSFLPPR